MFDAILVPTDGSECADAAIGYATDLAQRYDATVHVLTVVDSRHLENAPHYEQVKAEQTEMVERTADELADASVPIEHAVRTDVPHRAILLYAKTHDVDLVAMGTHGRTGVERYLLGSVTEKLVRLSDVPVLTIPETDDDAVTYPYTDVLVPTDGSEQAAAATDVAIDLTSTYDARLHALSVVDVTALGIDIQTAALYEELTDTAQQAVDTIATRARNTGLRDVQKAVQSGSPYSHIHDYVDTNDIDLVVMGTHGRSGLERYLLGSVAEKTVRTAEVPVLTVRQ